MQGLNEFFHMGGYAAYVWSAFGLSLATLLTGFVHPLLKERAILQQIRKKQQRERKVNESKT